MSHKCVHKWMTSVFTFYSTAAVWITIDETVFSVFQGYHSMCHKKIIAWNFYLFIYLISCFRAVVTTMWVWRGLWGVCMRPKESELFSQGWLQRCSETPRSLASTSCSTARPRGRCLKVRTIPDQQILMGGRGSMQDAATFSSYKEFLKNSCHSYFILIPGLSSLRGDFVSLHPLGELQQWGGGRCHGVAGHAACRCGEDPHPSQPSSLEHNRRYSVHL